MSKYVMITDAPLSCTVNEMMAQTPDALLEGRRNSDLVNWCLGTFQEHKQSISYETLMEEFNRLMDCVSPKQRKSMKEYPDTDHVLRYCYDRYSQSNVSKLWIPMEYVI